DALQDYKRVPLTIFDSGGVLAIWDNGNVELAKDTIGLERYEMGRLQLDATDYPGVGTFTYKLMGYCGSDNRIKGRSRILILDESKGK
ncbi:unnamed protein product, partial [marine sediment metagenome]